MNDKHRSSIVLKGNWFPEKNQPAAMHYDPRLSKKIKEQLKTRAERKTKGELDLAFDVNYLKRISDNIVPRDSSADIGRAKETFDCDAHSSTQAADLKKKSDNELELIIFLQLSPTLHEKTVLTVEQLNQILDSSPSYPTDMNDHDIENAIMKYLLKRSGMKIGEIEKLDDTEIKEAIQAYGLALIGKNQHIFTAEEGIEKPPIDAKLKSAMNLFPDYHTCSFIELVKLKRDADAYEKFYSASGFEPVIERAQTFEIEGGMLDRIMYWSQAFSAFGTGYVQNGYELRNESGDVVSIGTNSGQKAPSGFVPSDGMRTLVMQMAMTLNAGDERDDVGFLIVSYANTVKDLDWKNAFPAELFNTTPASCSDSIRIHHQASLFTRMKVNSDSGYVVIEIEPDYFPDKPESDPSMSRLSRGDIVDPFPICDAPTIMNCIDSIHNILNTYLMLSDSLRRLPEISEEKLKERESLLTSIRAVNKLNLGSGHKGNFREGSIYVYTLKELHINISNYLKDLPNVNSKSPGTEVLKFEKKAFGDIQKQLDQMMMYRVDKIRAHIKAQESVPVNLEINGLRGNENDVYCMLRRYLYNHHVKGANKKSRAEFDEWFNAKDLIEIDIGTASSLLNQMKVDSADFDAMLLTFKTQHQALDKRILVITSDYDKEVEKININKDKISLQLSELHKKDGKNEEDLAKINSLEKELNQLIYSMKDLTDIKDTKLLQLMDQIVKLENKKEKYLSLSEKNKGFKDTLLETATYLDKFIDVALRKIHELAPGKDKPQQDGLFDSPSSPPVPGPLILSGNHPGKGINTRLNPSSSLSAENKPLGTSGPSKRGK